MTSAPYNYQTTAARTSYAPAAQATAATPASDDQFATLVEEEVAANDTPHVVTSDFEMEEAAATTSAGTDFFGKDGLTFGDVVDAINPLNHIPILSTLFSDGKSEVSVASKLAGGVLMGGPIGLVASLANVIFEQATGKDIATSVMAALSGEENPAIQVAGADIAPEEMAALESESASEQVAFAPEITAADTAPQRVARVRTPDSAIMNVAATDDDRSRMLLELYGGSAPSAHRSYQNAQMRSYLNDVTRSQVI